MLDAILNAKGYRVDLTRCSLYTTHPPCLHCTQAILQAGIRVVVYGDWDIVGLTGHIYDLVYQAKACFKYGYYNLCKHILIITIFVSRKYKCYIRTNDDEKKSAIDLCNSAISFKSVEEHLCTAETKSAEEPKPLIMCKLKETQIPPLDLWACQVNSACSLLL